MLRLFNLPSIGKLSGEHSILKNFKQGLVRILLCLKESTYLWVRLNCLNSIHKRIFTIDKDLPNYWSSDCLVRWTFGLTNSLQLAHLTTSQAHVKKGDPKDKYNIFKGTTGLPKGSDTYGNGVYCSTRSSHSKRFVYIRGNLRRSGRITGLNRLQVKFYCSESQTNNIEKDLVELSKLSKKYPKNRLNLNLYKFMYKKELYLKAYDKLKSKPGNMTTALYPETVDGISNQFFEEVINSMLNRSFKFKPIRRIMILKNLGGERPLTIASPRDKIVLECIRIILEKIFEPTFKESSHGFRIGHSCHTALGYFVENSKDIKWVIEFDIVKCFDKIDNKILFEILEQRIGDKNFLDLIRKSWNSGYGFYGKININSLSGVPQGSIISPILCNIYLNELDKYMELFMLQFKVGDKPKVNKEYIKLKSKKEWQIKKGNINEALKIKKIMLKTAYYHYDEDYKRSSYVRYAYAFLVGLCCSYKEAKEIGLQIQSFLKYSLNLDTTYTIKSFYKDTIKFLGILLSKGSVKNIKINKSVITKRLINRINLYAPILDIIKKFKNSGLLDSGNKGKPKTVWMHMDIREIIYLYNSIIRGIINYYYMVDNRGSLVSLLWQELRVSCAKLLAIKFKLKTMRQVFIKFGRDINIEGFELFKPSFRKVNITEGYVNQVNIDVVPALSSSHKLLARLLNSVCLKCGSDFKVEMHHIRKISDLKKKKSDISYIMFKAKRKQIPLCRNCHTSLHRKI